MTLTNPQTRTAARIGAMACAAFFLNGITSHAHAADALDQIPTREVSFAGLNLAKHADVERLYRRIAAAASQVCDPVPGPGNLGTKVRVQRCTSEAIARAVADVDAPALTQYYAVKTHQAEARVARRQP